MKLDDDREQRVKSIVVGMVGRPLTPRESREVDVVILVLQNRAAAGRHATYLAFLSLYLFIQVVLGWVGP